MHTVSIHCFHVKDLQTYSGGMGVKRIKNNCKRVGIFRKEKQMCVNRVGTLKYLKKLQLNRFVFTNG